MNSTDYQVHELDNPPHNCVSCSLLTFNNESAYYQFIITPSITDSELNDHLVQWADNQTDFLGIDDVNNEIDRFLKQQRQALLTRLRSIDYTIYAITGYIDRQMSEDYREAMQYENEIPDDSEKLLVIHSPDILVAVSPIMDDLELRNFINGVLYNAQFATFAMMLDDDKKLSEWIKDKIDKYQRSRY